MKVNFFEDSCKEDTDAKRFGICDPKGELPAFITTNGAKKWIAIVVNPTKKNVRFYAIDHCLVMTGKGQNIKRCDAMLHYDENLVFVELKEVMRTRVSSAIKQIESTIKVFSKNHDLNSFSKKRAFVANRRHPAFNYSQREEMQNFYNKHKVRLILYNTIEI